MPITQQTKLMLKQLGLNPNEMNIAASLLFHLNEATIEQNIDSVIKALQAAILVENGTDMSGI